MEEDIKINKNRNTHVQHLLDWLLNIDVEENQALDIHDNMSHQYIIEP